MENCFYTQGVAVLLKTPVEVSELLPLLKGIKVLGQRDAAPSWIHSGPTLLVELDKGSKGRIAVDVVTRRWPDADEDESLAAAREAGQFGPTCVAGSLERACAFCSWPEGLEQVQQHRAFLRVRVTYTPEDGEFSTDLPSSYSSTRESEQMLGVVEALMEHPAALCYFNPNGEVLTSPEIFTKACEQFHKAGVPAVSLLANRRLTRLEGSDWMLADLVGMEQLDIPDLEVGFSERYNPNEVAVFLVNTALSYLKTGQTTKDGHTITGPGGTLFQAKSFEKSHLMPPREVVRFRPRDGTVSPGELGFGDAPLGKSAWWQFWKS